MSFLDTRRSLSRTRCGAGMTLIGAGMMFIGAGIALKGMAPEATAFGKENMRLLRRPALSESGCRTARNDVKRNFLTCLEELVN